MYEWHPCPVLVLLQHVHVVVKCCWTVLYSVIVDVYKAEVVYNYI